MVLKSTKAEFAALAPLSEPAIKLSVVSPPVEGGVNTGISSFLQEPKIDIDTTIIPIAIILFFIILFFFLENYFLLQLKFIPIK
ncbi:MAG: hypothetical protein AMXMBFR79_15000 [Chitinophagaceae bacterium]